MSEIIKARELIATAKHLLEMAEALMVREPPAKKKAEPKYVRITEPIREQVRSLATDGKTNHQIAEIVGLRNGGRVSEILHGKR